MSEYTAPEWTKEALKDLKDAHGMTDPLARIIVAEQEATISRLSERVATLEGALRSDLTWFEYLLTKLEPRSPRSLGGTGAKESAWVVVEIADWAVRQRIEHARAALATPAPPTPQDACEVCHGARGGVPGNENIKNGVVMCDYCSAERMPAIACNYGVTPNRQAKSEPESGE